MSDVNPQHRRAAPTLLEQECRDAIAALRRSLLEVYQAAGADPSAPQDVSRRFGINRNTASKLARLLAGNHPLAAFADLPGREGFRLALKSLSRTKAATAAAAGVDECLDAIDHVALKYADSREELVLMLESMGLLDPLSSHSSRSRELAFQGNTAIWGVSARARHSMAFFTPSAGEASHLDYVHVSQVLGFRRLRPNASWRLLRMLLADDKGGMLKAAAFPEGLDPQPDPILPLLVRPLCSANMPELETSSGPHGCDYILPAGPVGKEAEFDVAVGNIARGLPGNRTPTDRFGSVSASITLPVKALIFDLVLHRDLREKVQPEVLVYGFPHGGADGPSAQTVANLLWSGARLTELEGTPPAFATPLVPRIEQLAEYVFERMGWSARDFFGLRLSIPYPPMSSRVVLRWPLSEGPAEDQPPSANS